jgi:hypothetical protein
MLKYLSSAEQSRFAQLQEKLSQLLISDVEQQELSVLVGKAQKSAAERSQEIESVRKLIAESAIDIQSLFSLEAIQSAAAVSGVSRANIGKKAAKPKLEKTSGRSEQVLIQVKLDKSAGAPSRYKKGQKLGKFVSRNFKQLDVEQQLVENLMKYATPLGRTYFSTAEGQAELESFAQYVHAAPTNA